MGTKAWFVAFFFGAILFGIPTLILSLNTRSFAVDHFLQPAGMTTLKAKFPFPLLHYSSSSEGIRLVVKKTDYTEALRDYLRTNHIAVSE